MSKDWIVALKAECEQSSQGKAAKIIGYSTAVVSQVLNGVYNGDLSAVEQSVKGALMGATVDCPCIGDIPRNRCMEHQKRSGKMSPTNPLRVQLSRTCPTCRYALGG